MSLALSTPTVEPSPRPARETASEVLLRLGAFTLALGLASHLLLVHSRAFLAWCERASLVSAQPMRNEATLRLLRPGEAPLLVVGSSVVASDFDPDHLAHRFGVEAVSLPLYGGAMAEVAMVAPHLARARPRAVALFVSVWALTDHVDWGDVRVYDARMAWSFLTPRELLAHRQAHASGLLRSLHFLIRHRDSLRRHLAETTLGEGSGRLSGRRPSRGAFTPPPEFERLEPGAALLTCGTVNTRALEAMGRRLRKAGVGLVLVPVPGNRRWDRDPAVVRRFDECLAQAAHRTGSTLVPRATLPSLRSSDFRDRDHMGPEARLRFTDALGPALRAAAYGPTRDHAVQ